MNTTAGIPRLEAHALRLEAGARVLVGQGDLHFRGGECWALLGPNGAGKTRLLHALAGLEHPADGSVMIDGRPITRLHRPQLASRIAILLQDETSDYWGTTREYVGLGHRTGDATAVARALQEFELESLADQAWRTLSGGERQRARIAQVAAQDTPIRLLDEPLNHLDLAAAALVVERLAAWAAGGRLVVLSLHDPAWALRHCSHALLMYDSGRLEQGPAAQIITLAAIEKLYRRRIDWMRP